MGAHTSMESECFCRILCQLPNRKKSLFVRIVFKIVAFITIRWPAINRTVVFHQYRNLIRAAKWITLKEKNTQTAETFSMATT